MLRKAELRELPEIRLTSKDIKTAKREGRERPYYSNRTRKVPYFCKFILRARTAGSILKVALFSSERIRNGFQNPQYEIFIDTDQDKYITRELDPIGNEMRWSEAMIVHFAEYWNNYGKIQKTCHSSKGTDRIVRRAISKSMSMLAAYSSYEMIQHYQQHIKDVIREKAEKKECDPWDADMALVPKTTAAFNKWLRKEALEEYFIFYRYSRKIEAGWCDYCESEVDLSKTTPRHDKPGKCPKCGKMVTFKAMGKIKTLYTRSYSAQLVQKWKDGIVIRQFVVFKSYRNREYFDPEYLVREPERVIITETDRKAYLWELYKNRIHRWCRDRGNSWIKWCRTEGKIYQPTICLINRISNGREKLFKLAEREIRDISISKWITDGADDPLTEKLLKAGLSTLFRDNFNGYGLRANEKETELYKILGIDKMRLKRLRAMDGNKYALEWLQDEKAVNTIWPDEMIRDFSVNGTTIRGGLACFIEHMTPVQIWNYLKRQWNDFGLTWDKTMAAWADYLRLAEKLGMQMDAESVFRPKDVKKAHDEAVELLESKNLQKQARDMEKRFPKVRKVYPILKKYEYSDKDYAIVAPKSSYDIVREGTILKHCVHSCDYYWQRMEIRETYILFLRRASDPGQPYYTLEVEPHGNIRQKRTTGDNQNKDFEEAKKFLAKWQRVIQKRLNAEDRKLGKKSDAMRKAELKDIRDKKKRVWHGVLQGKLLADVLEADFMPVEEEAASAAG